jgi:hypothetical protein
MKILEMGTARGKPDASLPGGTYYFSRDKFLDPCLVKR